MNHARPFGGGRRAAIRPVRLGLAGLALVLLSSLGGCGPDVPSKGQAAAILLKALQSQCDVDNERFNRNDGYPFDRFTAFFNNTVLAHPDLYPRQAPQVANAEFGGTFGETGETIPLSFTIQAFWPGPYETGTISYCPWYVTKVKIDDITAVGPKQARVAFEPLKTPTRLANDLVAAGVIGRLPDVNAQMGEVIFRRYDALGWRLADQSSGS